MRANFRNIRLEIYGESHSSEISMELHGIPKGEVVSPQSVQAFVNRRKSGDNAWSTPRREPDIVCFESGITDNTADGGVIRATIKNGNVRARDYNSLINKPRPSHADYAAFIKGGATSGGGRFSGRMTAPLCIAGGIARDILSAKGIAVAAYISRIGKAKGLICYDDAEITLDMVIAAQARSLAVMDGAAENAMLQEIMDAKRAGDSVGGEIECAVFGVPVGLGDAMFDGLEGAISYAVFAVPAVKAIAFGAGFGLARMRGSEANDAFEYRDGKVVTTTNNSGGINGGVSNGMPLTLKVAVRPTPSISIRQHTVDLERGENTTIEIDGRHDACIVPRAVPCIEAAVSLALLDVWLGENAVAGE